MSSSTPIHRRLIGALGAVGLLGGVLTVAAVAAPAASAAPTVIAADLTAGGSVNLTSFTNPYAGAFVSAGDGFETYQRNVSPSIPFSVLDDSLFTFPTDSLGIVDDNNVDPFFGVTDTENPENTGPVSATWVFDISGGSDLALSIDMGAMGDFEASDTFIWEYAIDGGATSTAFASSVDEASDRTYTLAGGASFTLNDPMNVGATELSNVLQPVSAPLSGTGSQLELTLTASTDGGSEAFAFQNIEIISDAGSIGPSVGDLVITEIMQNPSAVSDTDGEWFEIANVSTEDVDLLGWTISDEGSDGHVIGSSVVVPAGGYAVLGRNADPAANGGVAVDYQYSSFFLANGDDEVLLTDPDGVQFDRVAYDGGPEFPDPNGASMGLEPTLTDTASNDDGANWCTSSSALPGGDAGTPGAENDSCAAPPPELFIHQVQGDGPTVAVTGTVVVEAVVTSLFTRDDVLDGFFIQEEDADADSDPATSEGIFVFCRAACPTDLVVGDLVEVLGDATEFFGMSQIDASGGSISIISSGTTLPSASTVDLPAPASTLAELTFEPLEGMIVTFPDTLVVSEYFQLARFGQVVLTESSRPEQFTQADLPSISGYEAFLDDLARRRIILDDDNNDNNDAISDGPDEAYPYPSGGLSLTNRFRGGDTIDSLTGVLHWSFAGSSGTDAWRVRPIQSTPPVDYSFESVNTAPSAPDPVGGTLTAASFNVLNYFTTLNEGPGLCGPSGTDGCRGANSAAELTRQKDKIVSAISTIDADIVGLIELENDGDDSSIADLVAGLNAVAGADTYDYIATGFIGTDAIKVGLIYQPASVTPYHDFAILDSSVDPAFDDSLNRPMLVQTFVENASGERLTVAVNHLKSKGSPCDDVGDPDLGDGQGNCSATRTAAATALADFLASDPTDSGDPDSLVLGDLNSYAMEDPIRALESAGYTDLLEAFGPDDAYSYLFDGQLGTLDYALANSSLSGQVTGATAWNINADEVPLFDYNDDILDPGEPFFERESGVLPIYAPDALRSSDHDPVIVGLALDSIPDDPSCQGRPATIVGTPGDDVIDGGNGVDVIVTFGGHDMVSGGNGDDVVCTGYGDDVIEGGNGDDVLEGGDGDDVIEGGNGDDVLDGGAGVDVLDGGRGEDTCLAGETLLACEIS